MEPEKSIPNQSSNLENHTSRRSEKRAIRKASRASNRVIKKASRASRAIRKANRERIRSLKKYKENPFRKNLLQELQTIKKREYLSQEGERGAQNIIVNGNAEMIGESRFFRYKKYDPEQFAKVFINRVSALWDMPKPATRMFSYILHILPKDKDEVFIDNEEAMEFTKYSSHNSINEGLKWLVHNEFIAKSTKTLHYFINPTIFFNGDRVAFVDMIIKESKPDPNQLDIFNGVPSGK